ncbi:MAG: hypothetical protein LBR49_00940, partial [Tannerella sp.]|nr:hypothetical protein [Tannerella sp.]
MTDLLDFAEKRNVRLRRPKGDVGAYVCHCLNCDFNKIFLIYMINNPVRSNPYSSHALNPANARRGMNDIEHLNTRFGDAAYFRSHNASNFLWNSSNDINSPSSIRWKCSHHSSCVPWKGVFGFHLSED